jgi:hypothetical protein
VKSLKKPEKGQESAWLRMFFGGRSTASGGGLKKTGGLRVFRGSHIESKTPCPRWAGYVISFFAIVVVASVVITSIKAPQRTFDSMIWIASGQCGLSSSNPRLSMLNDTVSWLNTHRLDHFTVLKHLGNADIQSDSHLEYFVGFDFQGIYSLKIFFDDQGCFVSAESHIEFF